MLLVDNGSDDGTGEEALRVAAEIGLGHKFTVKDYPFQVARAGGEHLAVNERSVHSLAYFYNWCFSHVRTRYSWKWDGDMVLTTEGEVSMADLSWQVGMAEAVIRFPRHGLYIESDRRAFLDLGLRNIEEWGFPMSPDYVYTKAPEWEIRTTPDRIEMFALPQGLCVELKWLDGDEFAHWTNPEAFATSIRNRRKRQRVAGLERPAQRRGARGSRGDRRPRGRARGRPRHPHVAAACPAALRGRRPRPRQAAPARLSVGGALVGASHSASCVRSSSRETLARSPAAPPPAGCCTTGAVPRR